MALKELLAFCMCSLKPLYKRASCDFSEHNSDEAKHKNSPSTPSLLYANELSCSFAV